MIFLPLNNFYQKNLKFKKKLIFKNFKNTKSYKKKQIYSPLNAEVRMENKNFWKIDFFYFKSQFILTSKFYFPKEFIYEVFFYFEEKKNLYQMILTHNSCLKNYENIFLKLKFYFQEV